MACGTDLEAWLRAAREPRWADVDDFIPDFDLFKEPMVSFEAAFGVFERAVGLGGESLWVRFIVPLESEPDSGELTVDAVGALLEQGMTLMVGPIGTDPPVAGGWLIERNSIAVTMPDSRLEYDTFLSVGRRQDEDPRVSLIFTSANPDRSDLRPHQSESRSAPPRSPGECHP